MLQRPCAAEHLTLHPASVEHLRLLGLALMQQRFGAAETPLKIAIEMAPDFAPLVEDLGSVLAQQRKFAEAIPLFEQAVRQDPKLTSAHKKLRQAPRPSGAGKSCSRKFGSIRAQVFGKKRYPRIIIA